MLLFTTEVGLFSNKEKGYFIQTSIVRSLPNLLGVLVDCQIKENQLKRWLQTKSETRVPNSTYHDFEMGRVDGTSVVLPTFEGRKINLKDDHRMYWRRMCGNRFWSNELVSINVPSDTFHQNIHPLLLGSFYSLKNTDFFFLCGWPPCYQRWWLKDGDDRLKVVVYRKDVL